MNDLERFFYSNTGRVIHKWEHYFEIYHQHLSAFRNNSPVVLEFGVSHGGSLQMWKHYFGKGSQIYGVDINPGCKEVEEEGISVLIGSQDDQNFLKSLTMLVPKPDIIIDDGGHTMNQQKSTFQILFPHLQNGGVYICEDTNTSYKVQYGGGYLRRGTFIEYIKSKIDDLHGFHLRKQNGRGKASFLTTNLKAMHVYDNIVVFDKLHRETPLHSMYGTIEVPHPTFKRRPKFQRIWFSLLTKYYRFLYARRK